MSKAKKDPRSDYPEDDEGGLEELSRNEQLADREDLHEALQELYKDIEQGLTNQNERSNEQLDFWDIYNCRLGEYQYYNGTSRIFLPIVHNAVNARVTRFVNQVFPQSGRNVEVTSSDGTIPDAEMALTEHYIRRAKLRTTVVPALLRNGDVEGQYNLYVSWQEKKRYVTWRTPDPVSLVDEIVSEVMDEEPLQHETIDDDGPHVEVLADSDVLILPHTADSVDDALHIGGSVTVLRRWSKARLKQEIAEGNILEDRGEALLKAMNEKKEGLVDKSKEMANAAGIKNSRQGLKFALIYETWTMLTIGDERRLCVILYGSGNTDGILSCKRNPNWSDKCSVISVPVEKVQGAAKGKSKVDPCAQTQYYANDVINEAADSSMFALMPIVMTDPMKNPRVGSMVLSLAAVWEVDPNSTKFAEMPELWKQGFEIVSACKAEIAQTLSVSPAAITQAGQLKSKQSQADIAREQQVDILTTADAVTVLEEGVLTPLINRFIELDHQYREKSLLIKSFGEMGKKATIEEIEPIQMGRKYAFRWFGVESARNAQQLQQQIAMVNVLRGIPPQQYPGRKLNLVPVIAQLVENTFGPRLAPLVFEDMASQMPIPADQENLLLSNGFAIPVHELDDDQQHLQMHMQLLRQPGTGSASKIKTHVYEHVQAMQRKQAMQQQMAMAAAMGPPGLPGAPGGAGPGMAGTPRPGATPGQPRFQGPPGMMHPDQVGPISGGMPRLRNGGV